MTKATLLIMFNFLTLLGNSQLDYPEPRQPVQLTYRDVNESGKLLYINVLPYRYEVWLKNGDKSWRKTDVLKSSDSTIFVKNPQDKERYTVEINPEDTKIITVLKESSGEVIIYHLESKID